MAEKDNSQDVYCGSPSTAFLSFGLPVRSKTYQRPSPLRQRLQTPGNTAALASEPFPQDNHPRSQPTADVLDTSVTVSRSDISSDTVYSTSRRYERLRSDEIRLLRLLAPESDVDSIAGSLASFTLGASPNYTAISYAWGDRKDISTISIDGMATSITTSLWHALMALRRRDGSVWIWADAISINQRDVDELNSQVHIMDKIYSKADTVGICLGPQSENDDIEMAFEVMEDAARSGSAKVTADQRRISSVVRLFERNYWKRLWVMQEVFHAKQADVYCGSACIALKTIFSACKTFKNFSGHIEKYFPAGKVIQTSENHYSYAQTLTTQGPNTLLRSFAEEQPLEILRICRSKLTARPQDKILGVLSLLPRGIRLRFPPDFHLTTQEVFTEIVICIIKGSRNLDVICESIRYPFHQNSFGLPSWVPDWSHSPDTLSLSATHLSHRRPFQAYPAYGFTDEFAGKLPTFNGNELLIKGVQIGAITARGMAVGTLGRLSEYLMAFLEWRHLLHDDEHYGETHTEAFCRTLCLGDVPTDVYHALDRQYDLKGPLEALPWVELGSPDAVSRQMD